MAVFRPITLDQIDSLSNSGDIIVTARYNYWASNFGGGGGGGGGSMNTDVPQEEVVLPDDKFRMSGESNCGSYVDAFNSAISQLVWASPTASNLVSEAISRRLSFNLIDTNESAGIVAHYDTGTKTVHWDPFAASTNFNDSNQPTGGITLPVIVLAHEIAHAMYPGYSEAQIGNIERQISAEYNAKINSFNAQFGSNATTNSARSNGRGDFFNTDGPFGNQFSLDDYGCDSQMNRLVAFEANNSGEVVVMGFERANEPLLMGGFVDYV